MITMAAYFVVFLAGDRKSAREAMLDGIMDKPLAVMIFSFLGAGVLGMLLTALLLGAVYSGAHFGDNIAPISDTIGLSSLNLGRGSARWSNPSEVCIYRRRHAP